MYGSRPRATPAPEPTIWPEQTHLDLQLLLGSSQVNSKHKYLQLLKIPTDWQVDHFRPEEQHRLGAKKETSLVELRNLLVYYSPTLLACSVYWSRWKGQHECCGKWSFQIFIIDIKWKATGGFGWLWGLTSLLERNSRRLYDIGVGIYREGKYLDHTKWILMFIFQKSSTNYWAWRSDSSEQWKGVRFLDALASLVFKWVGKVIFFPSYFQ